ncbi:MAG: hypothetical protein COW73_06700 [Nitrospirae bacterium CG18_big_fil_WC_8_21_14_2_50_70_55]|nr:hypothetical protein [Deltaproteobacteria bacterium]OIP67905.1 MAG: hypothetical protein AUK30_00110 [Nitrospirae bacterium CG2_30_70_394]PIQ04986.1 MAG: hypothetical protein COW73_06700 [Nitrospirae bacterium CG18_big_fil_WC_8_21_14_2_50_70_55]PIU77920.1 MAG: hypothetical protein COS73_08620 [Nitrospirae bacterium CG06_land_8_20_14_3_00_70_43]PIW83953.1 MAG: hypothetical protein COZ96_00640 [Nitrospirae bacterium CG_4_8_14_3_um_filter_70_85]PIX83029.1 MAG: hypothetical protein COZ33_07600 
MHRPALLLFLALLFALAPQAAAKGRYFDLPPLPDPALYGNRLLNRSAEKNGVKPALFSHWLHRAKYTCRVCHVELGFNMELGTTEITEARNQHGEYCGACHDGKEAFGHTPDNCDRCHTGDLTAGADKFNAFAVTMPRTSYGNNIDWVKAVKEGKLQPKRTLLANPPQAIAYDKDLKLDAGWTMIPPAFFSHADHNLWLDCANCHPDIFNVKKKTTAHFSMRYNLDGKFCGLCHLRVSFPLDDCDRCHPAMH